MKILDLDVERLNHACIKIKDSKIIYFDPYEIKEDEKADVILITHEHFDHCSVKDIKKVASSKTIIVASKQCEKEIEKLRKEVKDVRYLKPYEKVEIEGLTVEGVPAYNTNKPFHPKRDEKLGYVVTIDGKIIYHAGDTDFIPEMKDLKNIDIAFLPVSGTYVMTAEEAAKAADVIKPKVAIPIHYGAIVGTEEDAKKFANFTKVPVKIL
jgi:L-ascorbate metabolism protein UlaG (beta-lactamase superfamily)